MLIQERSLLVKVLASIVRLFPALSVTTIFLFPPELLVATVADSVPSFPSNKMSFADKE